VSFLVCCKISYLYQKAYWGQVEFIGNEWYNIPGGDGAGKGEKENSRAQAYAEKFTSI
jgi:hypothetical protein